MLLDTMIRKHIEVSPTFKTERCKHGLIFYYSYVHVISQDSLIFIVKSLISKILTWKQMNWLLHHIKSHSWHNVKKK